jgi:hypothetical protein
MYISCTLARLDAPYTYNSELSSMPCKTEHQHRWASLLKQQSSITVYLLLTKENKLPFPVPFAANKRNLPI